MSGESTCLSWLTALAIWLRSELPTEATRMTPSATADKTSGSDTASTGGESMTTRSATSAIVASNAWALLPDRSSDGSGGIGPEGTTNKFGSPGIL